MEWVGRGNKDMKVAIIVPIIGNFGRKGFYHSQEIGLGKEMAKHGNNVTVYKCVPVGSMKNITVEKNDGITIKYIPTKSFGPHGMLDVDLIDTDTNIAFVFSDTQFVVPKLYKYCKKNNIHFVPYVGIAHSFQQNFKSKLMDMLFKLTTLKVYKKVTVIAKTLDAKNELKELGVKKCVVAPVGMDFEALKIDYEQYDRSKIREEFGFKDDDVIISFVARLQPEKHPLELLDIFMQVKQQHKKLLIVGKGPLAKAVYEKIEKLNIAQQVVVLPEVKYEEMWKVHYISDYFLNLRAEEIFGMAIMEAIYYKSCVIALRAPGPNTILEGTRGHYLCNSFSDVSKIISQNTINQDDLQFSKNKLEKEFTWANVLEKIEEMKW